MSLRIQDLPDDDRPRERMLRLGPEALSDAELIALLLVTGREGANAVDVAKELLATHRSLATLLKLTTAQLAKTKGIGPAKAIQLTAAFQLGRRLAEERQRRQKVESPEDVYALMAPQMQALHKESLRVLLLDTRHHLLHIDEISLGSINESIAHPREIFRPALVHAAYGMILVHNHPSGDPSPSEADLRLTRRLSEASQLLQIPLLDHIIIGSAAPGHPAYYSFKEAGIL